MRRDAIAGGNDHTPTENLERLDEGSNPLERRGIVATHNPFYVYQLLNLNNIDRKLPPADETHGVG